MKHIWVVVLITLTSALNAGELTREAVKGSYFLGTPERGKTKVEMDFGNLGNKVVLAVGCKGCPTATYSFLKEESSTLGVATFFNTIGLYVFQYDENSWVVVQPDGQLGRKVWNKIGHANIYSKDANKAKSVARADIEKFAIGLSSKIMNQEVGEMSHSGGTYHLAVPVNHMGRAQSSYQVEFNRDAKKAINIKPCDKCSVDQYQHLPQESDIAGVDIYRHATSYYIFDLQDGVLITTFANASGLGKTLWGKGNNYNVLSNNKAYIRQILASKEKQDTIDKMMAEYFAMIKTEFEKRAEEERLAKVATRDLPAQGIQDSGQQKQALEASIRWAKAWNWKETINAAYFTSNDWAITRNRLTGVITGKVARGYITMKHPDGRCRFQYVSYRQDYDGSNYMNFHMTGVGPIYDLKCDKI
ncbi:hypothetical protein FLL45_22015 [Aliikangiella marina]|uniref:Uncharacterized protein n=1 Tax=Aliikangiella marina TaxID=1712262 RepID=A0A545T1A8_9GAMM|nr:hypothetical protein [Aliikangiella marina]TQV71006.1 hypothetical protein FLL45_22015 [Aliikangiella marina]